MAFVDRDVDNSADPKIPVPPLNRSTPQIQTAFIPLLLNDNPGEMQISEILALFEDNDLFIIEDWRAGRPRAPIASLDGQPAVDKAKRTIGIGNDGVIWTYKERPATEPQVTWSPYTNDKYQFAQSDLLPDSALQTGDYYYVYTLEEWIVFAPEPLTSNLRQERVTDITTILGSDAIFLGNASSETNANHLITNYDSSKKYYVYYAGEVRQLASYTPGAGAAATWVASTETLHHEIARISKEIDANQNRITTNKTLISEVEKRAQANSQAIHGIQTPLRFSEIPAHIDPDELIVLDEISHSSDKTYEFLPDTALYNTGGEYFEYWGYNTRNFGVKLPAFGSGGPSLFRDDRLVALYQSQPARSNDTQKLKVVVRTGLFDAASLSAGETKLIMRHPGQGHLIYTLQASTFDDTDAATRSVSGQGYSIYEAKEDIPFNLIQSAADNASLISIQITQLVSSAQQYLSDDVANAWANAITHTVGTYRGNADKRPYEVEINAKGTIDTLRKSVITMEENRFPWIEVPVGRNEFLAFRTPGYDFGAGTVLPGEDSFPRNGSDDQARLGWEYSYYKAISKIFYINPSGGTGNFIVKLLDLGGIRGAGRGNEVNGMVFYIINGSTTRTISFQGSGIAQIIPASATIGPQKGALIAFSTVGTGGSQTYRMFVSPLGA